MSTVTSRLRVALVVLALLVQVAVVAQSASAAHLSNVSILCGPTVGWEACDRLLRESGNDTITVVDFPPPAAPPSGAACGGTPPSGFEERLEGKVGDALVMDCMAAYPPDGEPLLKGKNGRAALGERISRAQYLVTLLRAAGGAGKPGASQSEWVNPAVPTFPDVPRGHVFYRQIETAVKLGLFSGTNTPDEGDIDRDGDKTEKLFLPGANISYAQIAKSDYNFLRALGIKESGSEGEGSTGLDCKAFAVELRALEVLKVLGLGSELPDKCVDPATRGQAYHLLAAMTNLQVTRGIFKNPYAPPDNTAFTVVIEPDPKPDQEQDPDREPTPAGNERWAVTNPIAGLAHTIQLFAASRVQVGAAAVTFLDGNGQPESGGVAQPGTVSSRLVEINGTTGSFGQQANAERGADLLIQFMVKGVHPEKVIPVVYYDANKDGKLNLDDKGLPTEDHHFGVGGRFDVPAPAGLSISPTTTVALLDDDDPPDETSDRRAYTVTTPQSGDHRVVLFEAGSILTDAAGVYFLAANGMRETGGTARPPFVAAAIVRVNGVSGSFGPAATATPTDATITFRVDAAQRESVIPVVFVDADGDGLLDLDATGHPVATEPFVLGGRIDGLAPKLPTLETTRTGSNVAELTFDGVLSTATIHVHLADDTGNVGSKNVPAYDPDTFTTQTFVMPAYGPYSIDTLTVRLTGLTADRPYQLYYSQTVTGIRSFLGSTELRTRKLAIPTVGGSFAFEGTDPSPKQTNELRVNFSEPIYEIPNPTGLKITIDGKTLTAVSAHRPTDPVDAFNEPGTEWAFIMDGPMPFGENFSTRMTAPANLVRDLDRNGNPSYPPPKT